MKYKVGDKVRVRQWDDMAKEFGESFGSIDIPHFYFPRSMEKYCGEVVTIEKADTCSYHIKEDEEHWYWTDDMFEPYKVTLARQADFIDKEAYSKLIKQLEKQPIIFAPKSSIDGFKVSTGLINNIAKETREMVKKNIETEIEKKKVHPKDEDHLKRVEKIKKKIEYYKWKSGFNLIDEVVPGRVVKVTYYYKKYEMVCDPRDEFSMEKVLYLAIAKEMYGHTLTPEGIEKKAEELKYEKVYVKKVEQAMKMLAAMKELGKENAEYEALLEARRQKRWERKQRQMDRRAEKKRIQEEAFELDQEDTLSNPDMYDQIMTMEESFNYLEECGFNVVEHILVDENNVEEMIEKFNPEEYELPVDGLIFKYNDVFYGNSLGN